MIELRFLSLFSLCWVFSCWRRGKVLKIFRFSFIFLLCLADSKSQTFFLHFNLIKLLFFVDSTRFSSMLLVVLLCVVVCFVSLGIRAVRVGRSCCVSTHRALGRDKQFLINVNIFLVYEIIVWTDDVLFLVCRHISRFSTHHHWIFSPLRRKQIVSRTGRNFFGARKKATKIVLVCCVWKLSLSTQQTIIFWMMFIVLWLWKFNGRRSCCCSNSAVWTCLLMQQWTLKMWNLGLSRLPALAESSKSFLFAGITSLVIYTTKQWRFRDISKKFIESMIISLFQRVFNFFSSQHHLKEVSEAVAEGE